jgi:very-short-patch-repair endonuclease
LDGAVSDYELARRAAEQHGVIALEQARNCGLTDRQVRLRVADGRWELLHPKVYRIAGAPTSFRQRLMAASLAGGRTAIASHRSAAELWGFDTGESEIIEITTEPGHARSLRRVRVHGSNALLPTDRRVVDGIPVAAPELTLLQCAGVLDPQRVEACIDDAIRRRITTVARIEWRMRILGRRGRNGSGVLRELLQRRSPEARAIESRLEGAFLAAIRTTRLATPTPQFVVRSNGHFVARVDFAWPEQNLLVELDGAAFHASTGAWNRDLHRQNLLTALGYTILRFTWWDVHEQPQHLIALIERAMEHRGVSAMLDPRGEAS